MQGAVLEPSGDGASREVRVRVCSNVPLPIEEHGWALVRVLVAGVCGTDLEMTRGYKGGFEGVLGHEFVGEVERLVPGAQGASSSPIKVGDRVVGEINIPCEADSCAACQQEGSVRKRNHCPSRRCLGIWGHGGAFAERLSLPLRNLYAVDACCTDEVAAFAEPVAAACRVLEQLPQLRDTGQQRVCVVGDGRLGLLVAAVLAERAHASTTVEVLGRHEHKLALVAEAYPRLQTTLCSEEAVAERKGTVDFCVEATGSHAGLETSTRLMRPLGTLVLKSTCAGPASTALPAMLRSALEREAGARTAVVVKELTLLGSRCGPFPEALALMTRSAALRGLLAKMVHGTFPLSDMDDALAKAATKGVLKVQLRISHAGSPSSSSTDTGTGTGM